MKHVHQLKNVRLVKKASIFLSKKISAFQLMSTAQSMSKIIRTAPKMELCSIIAMNVQKMLTLTKRPMNASHAQLFQTVLNVSIPLSVLFVVLTGSSIVSSDASLLTFLTAKM